MDTTTAETGVTRKIVIRKVFPASCQSSSAEMARNVFRSTKSATIGTSVATGPMRRIAISPPATADNSGAKMHFVSQRGGDAMDIRTAPMGRTRRIVLLSPALIINSTAPRVEKTGRRNALIKASSAMESPIATMALTRRTIARTVCALPLDVSLNAEALLKGALVPVQLARRLGMTRDPVSIEMNAKNGISVTKSATIQMAGSNVPVSRVMSWKIGPIVKPNCPTQR